jgi:hypothetical protein
MFILHRDKFPAINYLLIILNIMRFDKLIGELASLIIRLKLDIFCVRVRACVCACLSGKMYYNRGGFYRKNMRFRVTGIPGSSAYSSINNSDSAITPGDLQSHNNGGGHIAAK